MAIVECKSELIAGWYLGGEEPSWPQTADFPFCHQLQQHPQLQQQHQLHHQLHHQLQHQLHHQHQLDFPPVEAASPGELQHQPLFPATACSGFSSPASFLTADGTSDCSGYLLAPVPSVTLGAPAGDCDDQQQHQLGGQVSPTGSSAPGPSGSGRRSGGAARRGGAGKAPASAQSAAAARCGGEPKVKTPVMVAKRNARERRRVEAVNSAFARLRRYIPYEKRNKRLSKVKTLRITIEYIHLLEVVLEEINGGIDIECSPNYQSLVQLAQRKELAIPLTRAC